MSEMCRVEGYIVLLSGRRSFDVGPVKYGICGTIEEARRIAEESREFYSNVFIRPCGAEVV